ncbi:Hypothetical protein FKW44_004813, partial [Caligus rogercresseyi]
MEWRTTIFQNGLYMRLMFGSDLTNSSTNAISKIWAAAQRVVWKFVPKFQGDSTVDIV